MSGARGVCGLFPDSLDVPLKPDKQDAPDMSRQLLRWQMQGRDQQVLRMDILTQMPKRLERVFMVPCPFWGSSP